MLTCPSCRKRYKNGVLACKQCRLELLPPSAIELRDRYPDLASHYDPPHPVTQEDQYVELAQCSLNEVKLITRLLEPEGIVCQIEKDEGFNYEYHLEGNSQISDQRGLIIKVKAAQFSKAHALLSWEIEQEPDHETLDSETTITETLACPACGQELAAPNDVCSYCSLSVGASDMAELTRIYRCSVCGASCHHADSTCPACGAQFNH
jgi:rubrerythrin